MSRATRLARISMTVSDLARAEAFYRDGLGFASQAERTENDPALLRLLGLEGRARSIEMALGAQRIALFAFDPPGAAYPAGSNAADIWFQHCAVVVRDMHRAYARVRRQDGFSPISHDGPQALPPAAGSVDAFKFRDPDGHPLELLHFPPGSGPAAWRDHSGDALCLGIDHSAIVVADAQRSVDFYTKLLGMSVAARTHNVGPAQDRLDRLAQDVVDVIALSPAAAPTPHVELLAYHVPAVAPGSSAAAPINDIAPTRLVFEVDAIAPLADRLRDAAVTFVSPGIVDLRDGSRAALIRDPDGHAIVIVEPFHR